MTADEALEHAEANGPVIVSFDGLVSLEEVDTALRIAENNWREGSAPRILAAEVHRLRARLARVEVLPAQWRSVRHHDMSDDMSDDMYREASARAAGRFDAYKTLLNDLEEALRGEL